MNKLKINRSRDILKAISWRILGSTNDFVLGWLILRDANVALSISISTTIAKLFLYYGHERLWHKIRYGIAYEKL